MPSLLHASLPSPSSGVLHVGPLPLRAYAFAIILGVVVAAWLGERRWVARGGRAGEVGDVAVWAVPMGILGARLYHVVSSPEAYFGAHGEPLRALRIWEGGLSIWGAVLFGAFGAWIGCRRRGIKLPPFGDAIAPGIALAQAIGRLGNWFNQELFGRASTLPWALEIDSAHRPAGSLDIATYHPAFLYELLWDVGVAVLVIWADRRFRMGHGRAFALYVGAYCVGRSWIEALRVDDAEHLLGLRLNQFTAAIGVVGAVAYIVVSSRLRPGRETDVRRPSATEHDDAQPAVEDEGPGEGTADHVAATSVPVSGEPASGKPDDSEATPGPEPH